MFTFTSGTRRVLLLGSLALAAAAAGFWLAAGLERAPAEPPRISGTYLEGGRPMAAFELWDHQGAPFTPTRFRFQWTLVTFGFTYCPDVCPLTLSTLAEAVRQLEAATGEGVETVFITVDPERDPPEQLRDYLPFFDPGIIGVTGEMSEIRRLTGSLGIAHMRRDYNGGYTVDHSSAILLINPEGQLQAVFTPPHSPATLAEDVAAVRDYWEHR